jgi:hypothetical protein
MENPLGGDPVQSIPGTVYQKTYWINRQRWPDGLRVFYCIDDQFMTVFVDDVGDHHTSARHPGQSVYPDER